MEKSNLEKLLEGIKSAGVEKGSRNRIVAEKTGYSEKTVNKLLSGNAVLTGRFIKAVCTAFGINDDSVSEKMGSRWVYKDPCPGNDSPPTDAPTLEIVQDMQKLSESNRWLFVGRAKPIITELLQGQENHKEKGA